MAEPLVQAEYSLNQISEYVDLYDRNDAQGLAARKERYAALARFHHTLGGALYEIGWGQSFHFCPFRKGEDFPQAIQRHEHFIADRLGLRPGMVVLDSGCGVGGPMREIARYSGATIVGVNIVAEQVEKVRLYNRRAGLTTTCSVLLADFMKLPVDAETYDRAYAIGSTCHAPDRTTVFKEVFRVLKPGGLFVADECCLTDRYDPTNAEHRRIKRDFERGYGLPELVSMEEVRRSIVAAGFELLEANDRALESDAETPWYSPLMGSVLSLRGMARSVLGRRIINRALSTAEFLHIAPRGSHEVSDVLNAGADATVEAGEKGIVTALYFVLARKSSNGGDGASVHCPPSG